LTTAPPPDPAAEASGQYGIERLQDTLGSGFVTLPSLHPSNATLLRTAFGASDVLQGGDPLAVGVWLRRVAEVRPGAGQLSNTLLVANLLQTASDFQLKVAQLPFAAATPPARWVGLPTTPQTPSDPTTGFAAWLPTELDFTAPFAGLLVDDWVEVIPEEQATTAIAFDGSAPGARPPQAILLAVNPDPTQAWSRDVLTAVLRETMDLARLRLVDLEAAAFAGRALPALYVADNALNAVPSVHFRDIVRNATQIFTKASQ
jgi:hypothetical protein